MESMPLAQTYTADETTLTLDNNQFSVKDGGIDTTQLNDDSVNLDKIDKVVLGLFIGGSL